jgi:hypothetical protein
MQPKNYRIGPFVIRSEVELPYRESSTHECHARIVISSEYPAPPLERQISDGAVSSPNLWWFFVAGRVSSVVSSSGDITLVVENGLAPSYMQMMCGIRVFLVRQGVMLLHGSAVAQNGSATVWLGASGDGKSTAAAIETVTRGAIHLSDDIVPLLVDERGEIVTFQCDRYAHLAISQPPGLESLAKALPASVQVRDDGKGMYLLSPPDTNLYPVRRVVRPRSGPQGAGILTAGADDLKVLIRSVIHLEELQKTKKVELLSFLGTLLTQGAEG